MKLRLLTFSLLALLAFPAAASAQTFTNPTPFSSPFVTSATDNPYNLYPTEIAVAGTVGAITDVNVTLRGVTNNGTLTYNDFLLVSPSGTGVILISNTGGAAQNVTLTLDQQESESISVPGALGVGTTVRAKPTIVAGVSRPSFPAPAPSFAPAERAPDLNRLNGQAANGTWKLYANHYYSFMGATNSAVNAGWSLDIETVGDTTPPAFARPAVSGNTIGFDLTEASSIQFRVDRISKGVKVKSKCLAPKKGRKGKGCSRYIPLPGAIDTIGVAGINSFAWNGRIGNKKLAPGKYRLTGIAKDAAGNQSPPQKFTVTIKKPKKKKKS